MKKRGLRFEQLERRVLLAGDVNVTFSRGNLNITGDGGDNQIEIALATPNTFQVTGNDDTTLGGNDDPLQFVGVNSIRINMKEGDNRVEVRGTDEQPFALARDLRIQSGSGDDVILVEQAEIGGQLSFSTPGGNNHAAILSTSIVGNLSIKTGNGAKDQIGIAGVTARNLSLDGGNSGRRAALGDAEIAVTGSTIAGGLTIRTGVGNDQVGVGDNDDLTAQIEAIVGASLPEGSGFSLGDAAGPVDVIGNLSITTSTGNDRVLVQELNAAAARRGGFTINTSHGTNKVVVMDSDIARNISITTGNDNDQVGLVNVQNAVNVSIRTGNGAKDQIGVADVGAASITLDGGNAGRRAAAGDTEIGVTGSTLTGNLTIKTGVGDDRVGVGDNTDLIAQVQQTVAAALPEGSTFALEEAETGPVDVTGSVSLTTSNGSDEVLVQALIAPPIRRGGFTINAGDGDNQVGIVDSSIQRDINVTTGSGDDQVGLVDVRDAANITVRTGNGAVDQIGLAGVQAANITLDGGNAGRRAQLGNSEIGITGSTVANNLTIKTGAGDDQVALGNHPDLVAMIQTWKGPATLEVPTGNVDVANSLSIATSNGNDDVWVQELVGSANMAINTGNGDDKIGIVGSAITGNIVIDMGNSTGGRGNEGDQVGMIGVTAVNLTVNNSLGNAAFGLAEVNAAKVTLNGGNAVNRQGLDFGPTVIGVTNSTFESLTIRQGHPPDDVAIGVWEDFATLFQIPDPVSKDGGTIAYQTGLVDVADGTVSITSNSPGRVSFADAVHINHLHAQSLNVNTGMGDDNLTIGENVLVTQKLDIKTGADNDRLTIEVAPDVFLANITAPDRTVDGGAGGGDTLRNSDPAALLADAAFKKGWDIPEVI